MERFIDKKTFWLIFNAGPMVEAPQQTKPLMYAASPSISSMKAAPQSKSSVHTAPAFVDPASLPPRLLVEAAPETEPMSDPLQQFKSLISTRFKICYGRHRPGRKNKVWEDDGYLTIDRYGIVNVTDLRGRPLEQTVIDDEVKRCCETSDDLLIGKTEVQVLERLE